MHASAEDGRGWAASGDQELRWETVLDVYERSVDATVHLDIVDEVGGAASIVTTTEHPFWRYGAGWLPAKDLRGSDRVWSAERGWLRIVRMALRYVQEPVYNLRVDSSHTYFVSDLAVWVHNQPCGGNGTNASPVPAAEGSSLKPEAGYLRGKRHGIKQQPGDAMRLAREEGKPHGVWGDKADLAHAGEQASTLSPGQMADFPIRPGSKSVVYNPDGSTSVPDMIRVRNNGDGTFHGFPIHSTTAGPIVQ